MKAPALTATVDKFADVSTTGTKGHVNVSASMLKRLGASVGQPILLSSLDNQSHVVARAWPHKAETVRLDRILSLVCTIQPGSVVQLSSVALKDAEQLTLEHSIPDLTPTAQSYLTQSLVGMCVLPNRDVVLSLYGKQHVLSVVSPPPSVDAGFTAYTVTASTIVTYVSKLRTEEQPSSAEATTVTYESIGGLKAQIAAIREVVEGPLLRPEIYVRYGTRPPRGVLLYGPPGTGKTMLARAVAAETRASFFVVNGSDLVSKYYGETESRLRELFTEAQLRRPSIIFLDEVDALAPKRSNSHNESEARTVSALLTLMDGLWSGGDGIVVLAATNRPDAIDAALRRPGRFDREVEIGIPSAAGRSEILRILLSRVPHCIPEEDIARVAASTHGMVGADLTALVREAALRVVRRVGLAMDNDAATPPVTAEDLTIAQTLIKPSALREVAVEVPCVRWNEIGGYEDVKQRLREAIEWPLRIPEAFTRMGIRPPKGLLLYGPPGCSKTLMAKALATESEMNFIAVKGPEVFSKWVGESERTVRETFRKARAAAPCIVFFDEIDAITLARGGTTGDSGVADRVLAQMLNEMDGVEALSNVLVVAATNRPDVIDKALMRPGRIDRILYVGLPDLDSRHEVFSVYLRKMPHSSDVTLTDLAQRTDGYTGAEIAAVCREAGMAALQESMQACDVHLRHFETALQVIRPRTTPQLMEFYRNFQIQ